MVDIRKKRVGTVFHVSANGNNNDDIIVERTELPIPYIKDGMDTLGKTVDMESGILINSQHSHKMNDFDLSKVGDDNVIKALKKDIKLPKETLVKRLEELAKWTSSLSADMKKNNLALIEKFVNNNNGDSPKENFKSDILTNEVLNNRITKEFNKSIKDAFRDQLKDAGGVLRKLENSEIKIERPSFSGIPELFGGLTFAINNLQAYSVQVTEYAYDFENKRFDATIEIAMYDHFGLDYGDIRKFGTAENIIKEKPILGYGIAGTALLAETSLVTGVASATSSDQIKEATTIISAASGIISLASGTLETFLVPGAEGFRAWFILQHYFGCMPFKTEINYTIPFKGESLL
jgi:hypothetical protein